ncbi:hypothetical protein BO70DRAFT_396374 [Aspergillus heteromorphus CBS 117.55]|uniref:F-box domain-containing protein n=1 Tax=Aspergillus heteromorphus CBS 117.55 TaxID=1448321 RepID=A0A317W9V2_9EURO|nr:uncharacterized protein BO70DRAFT_396374 [Aspergillus heteromorphus CBS 117.55]PWY82082.1 hypothetical protein BO70DRAFT_396374 [Aspergillus heteromorphus CBS 117.55]
MDAVTSGRRAPELLEMILENVPPSDLLVNCQRVCKNWRHMIQASLPLRQALFMEPSANVSEIVWLNPLLARSFPFLFPGSPARHRRLNSSCFGPPSLESQRWSTETQFHRAFFRPESSWRKMMLANYPTRFGVLETTGGLEIEMAFPWRIKPTSTVQDGPKGLLMGRLWDIMTLAFARNFLYMTVTWYPRRDDAGHPYLLLEGTVHNIDNAEDIRYEFRSLNPPVRLDVTAEEFMELFEE